jgi:hypothetical protein
MCLARSRDSFREHLQDLPGFWRTDGFEHLDCSQTLEPFRRANDPWTSQQRVHPPASFRGGIPLQGLSKSQFDSVTQFFKLLGSGLTNGERGAVKIHQESVDSLGWYFSNRL